MESKLKKPHVLCIPAPAQGHINPMLKLAKILHSKGFIITFVNTEFNHDRLIRSQGADAVRGFPSFYFETIPDGLSTPKNHNATQDVVSVTKAMEENLYGPFKSLLIRLTSSSSCSSDNYRPAVTCIVADFVMSFTLDAARELDIPEILLHTAGAGSLACFDQYPNLLSNGLMPLKDSSFLVNGYLETTIDCIPAMPGLRLKDIPSFIRMVLPGDEYMTEFWCLQVQRAKTASAIIINTFHELEGDILDTLASTFPPFYDIGPLNLLEKKLDDGSLASIKSSLWKEEFECLKWLDSKPPLSVIYVNFGSITVMTSKQLKEFCGGLSESNHSFLWIIRPDLVIGDSAMIPSEFLKETSNRGLIIGWCPQQQVLNHPSIGGFITHCGWNSTIESISSGVPMICWPYFADQHPNCWLSCNKWEIAMEIDNDVKHDELAKMVIELISGEKGNDMRKNAIDLKKKAEEACSFPYGSSMDNINKVIHLLNNL